MMNGRNGKTKITDHQIDTITRLIKGGHTIRSAARSAGISYSVAWNISKGHYNTMQRSKEETRTGYFEHDEYYKW